MSPYPTGGGGVTFERKVAVQYLAHLLVGDGAMELGDGRFVVSVAFQQAPEHSVDDLVIRAARADESEPSLVLAVGVRRSPDLVQSDESTKKLIRAFVHEVINAPVDGPEHRVALVVAGAKTTPNNWRGSPISLSSRWTRRASSTSFARRASFPPISGGGWITLKRSSGWHL